MTVSSKDSNKKKSQKTEVARNYKTGKPIINPKTGKPMRVPVR